MSENIENKYLHSNFQKTRFEIEYLKFGVDVCSNHKKGNKADFNNQHLEFQTFWFGRKEFSLRNKPKFSDPYISAT